ncbi:Anti-sigma B factor RsbT [Pseudoalteromonas luteoviolacea B = ATCC 29581]|nr:Anti-sigma B factor RsbT [Pseudoalteromonas luteoviolacea B = ATCC 29581]
MNCHDVDVQALVGQLSLDYESDAYHTARIVKQIAVKLGFAESKAGKISLAVSEICMNAVLHGRGGIVIISTLNNNQVIEILIEDKGPGIADLNLAFKDGYSTGGTLGLGLGAAKRAVEEFHIETSKDGTRVILRDYLPVYKTQFDIGVVSFPAHEMFVNGDGYLIKPYKGTNLFLSVLDGAGNGQKAHDAVHSVITTFENKIKQPLSELIQLAHLNLVKEGHSRGVELAVAKFEDDIIHFAAIGNLHITLRNGADTTSCLINGRLGLNLPNEIKIAKKQLSIPWTLIICTDGIRRFEIADLIAQTDYSAQKLAENIFNRFADDNDDATVLVVTKHD